MQIVLPFEQIPAYFKPGQKVTVIEAALSGVQSFIFSDQSINGSVEMLAAKSAYIMQLTKKIDALFSDYFSNCSYRILSCSSGKVIAAVNGDVDEKKFKYFADDLQLDVFSVTGGKIQLNCALAQATVCGAEYITPQTCTVSKILAMKLGSEKYRSANLLCRSPRQASVYGLGMEYVSGANNANMPTEDCVAIKLDLDNLGVFFSSLLAFDVHNTASHALDQVLSGCTDSVVYAGGDDIFAIVPLSKGLHTIAQMYRNIREGVQNNAPLQPYVEHFSISGGAIRIPFSNGKVPAAYYFSESEEMLKKAKGRKKCICISGVLYSWEDILTVSDLLDQHRQQLVQRVGQQYMPDYYLNPRQIVYKLKEMRLGR